MLRKPIFLVLMMLLAGQLHGQQHRVLSRLQVSGNHRYLMTADGKPFFWLADTGWLLFSKLNRAEAETYLEDRRKKGFNVIQVMLLHGLPALNVYKKMAVNQHDISRPVTTAGSSFTDSRQYDYWDHIDYIIDLAAKKGIYMALVPVWGTNVKNGWVSPAQARSYAAFLARRYRGKSNIIWLNGGDIKGSDSLQVWQTIGKTLRANDPRHLISFHPRGRRKSSEWFHNEKWLDFNMVQSGHQRYDQDTSKKETLHYGEDNWRYIQTDYALMPAKPTIDGEPSYENIPQGLHDVSQPRWGAADVRRYGYWSVFSGAFGYTYGENAVMQMHKKTDRESAYGSDEVWSDALDAPGATQMIHLKNLLLSRSYFDRIPDTTVIAGTVGTRYDHLIATRGNNYLMVYTYTGRNFSLHMGHITGKRVKVSWFNPRNGHTIRSADRANYGTENFNPPGETKAGNDWVLILDSIR